jgi:hypothetical protein
VVTEKCHQVCDAYRLFSFSEQQISLIIEIFERGARPFLRATTGKIIRKQLPRLGQKAIQLYQVMVSGGRKRETIASGGICAGRVRLPPPPYLSNGNQQKPIYGRTTKIACPQSHFLRDGEVPLVVLKQMYSTVMSKFETDELVTRRRIDYGYISSLGLFTPSLFFFATWV